MWEMTLSSKTAGAAVEAVMHRECNDRERVVRYSYTPISRRVWQKAMSFRHSLGITCGHVGPLGLNPGNQLAPFVVNVVLANAHEVRPIETPGVHGRARVDRFVDDVLRPALHVHPIEEAQGDVSAP